MNSLRVDGRHPVPSSHATFFDRIPPSRRCALSPSVHIHADMQSLRRIGGAGSMRKEGGLLIITVTTGTPDFPARPPHSPDLAERRNCAHIWHRFTRTGEFGPHASRTARSNPSMYNLVIIFPPARPYLHTMTRLRVVLRARPTGETTHHETVCTLCFFYWYRRSSYHSSRRVELANAAAQQGVL